MSRSMASRMLLVAAAMCFFPAPLASQESSIFQELGGFASMVTSDHPELPTPMGFGASTYWRFGGNWLARLSYHRVSDETTKLGTVCRQYSQRIDCVDEMTETSVTFSGLRGALLRAFHLGEVARVGLGGGLSFNHVDAKAMGETGRPADLLAPNAGQIGYLGLLSLAVAPVPRIPVKLIGGFTAHWVNFSTCSGEDPPQYDPFCGMDMLREVEVGLSFAF